MLLELTIKDFAIIDSLHLHLNRLFNVFTGETGAGKSIIIDAVNALLGGKIGAEFVRSGCERATVEGVFSIEALPAIEEAGLQLVEASAGATNGASAPAGTLFDAFDSLDVAATATRRPALPDAQSADARVALATLLSEYGITPEDGQLILSRD